MILRRLLVRLRPYWWGSSIAVVLVVILSAFRLGPAWFVKLIVDNAIPEGNLRLVALYVAGLFGVAVATSVLSAVQLYLEQWVGQRVVFDLRGELYDHLQSQSMSFYDANQTGQLMSRVTNDVSQVQAFLTQGLTRLVNTVVTIGVNLTVMLLIDPLLTLVAMSVTPIVVYFQLRMATAQDLYRQVARQTADLNVVIQENVSAVKLVKAFDREEHRVRALQPRQLGHPPGAHAGDDEPQRGRHRAGVRHHHLRHHHHRLRRLAGDRGRAQRRLAGRVLRLRPGHVGPHPLDDVRQPDVAAGDRRRRAGLRDPGHAPGRRREAGRGLPPPAGRAPGDGPGLASPTASSRPCCRTISVAVEPGQTLALVGPSGSGKTTLINLIPRFYDVSRGAVRVDGHDVRDVALESLRSQIGMVMQETFLFNRSVAENVRYGRPEATREAVEAAARAANAHDFIAQFPEGYDTVVGERGVRLSGGQRQRLAIARAILVDPRILILDEATSSVDTRTDYLIRQALDALMQGRTTVVIAHRLSTVQRAHQILVMEKGRITGRGTHAELLRTSPLYQHLYEIQFHLEGGAGGVSRGEGEARRVPAAVPAVPAPDGPGPEGAPVIGGLGRGGPGSGGGGSAGGGGRSGRMRLSMQEAPPEQQPLGDRGAPGAGGRPAPVGLILATVCVVVTSALQMVMPWGFKQVIDSVIPRQDTVELLWIGGGLSSSRWCATPSACTSATRWRSSPSRWSTAWGVTSSSTCSASPCASSSAGARAS